MAKRQSTYLDDNTLSMIRPGDSCSGRINQLFDRYGEMLRRDTRATLRLFTAEEQRAILSACLEWDMIPAATIPGGIAADVDDSSPEELGLTGFPEQEVLVAKLNTLTAGQQMCLAEWIEGERIRSVSVHEDEETRPCEKS